MGAILRAPDSPSVRQLSEGNASIRLGVCPAIVGSLKGQVLIFSLIFTFFISDNRGSFVLSKAKPAGHISI